jgi:alpha/beta superfamily hydrolase
VQLCSFLAIRYPWFLMTTHAAIRSLFIKGPTGRIEALLNVGVASAPYSAVVAHPHPLYGGTMHNKVVFHAMKALNSFGFHILRFNFRGVGSSAGTHDHGRGETEDVRAAIDWHYTEFGLPVIFTGFSFGAAVGLRVACEDSRVPALIALGIPISAEGRGYSYSFLSSCQKPKLFVSGAQDQFAPAGELPNVIDAASGPKQFVLVPGADHFFTGHLDEMRAAISDWVRPVLLPS